ncbi:hypothetical protein [Lactobacillus sp. CBA3605]|uniref:hypothetical protein n=1 Tax=Lactobacillus sp. CBA3605 TaxID=2099788 RepID=UPI00131A0590|nr:hypothetical protein [Lactobacillus sp. CBA3605]
MFLTAILVAMLALTKAFFPLKTATPSDQWLNLGLAWLATLAANMLRPIMLVFILALIILSLWLWIQKLALKRHLRQLIIYIGATVLLISCSPLIYNWLYGIPLAPTRVSTAYSLATGTDSHSAGQYDPAIMIKR